MNNSSIFSRVRSSAKRFRRAEDGNIAVMFAIAIVPILGFIGAAVDYSRVNSARTAMQAAIDTAALMVSKDVTATATAGDITSMAQKYFSALYNHPEATNVAITAKYTNNTTTGSQLVLTGSATMATDFMKVAGYPTIDFGTSSTTVWGTTKLRVAMALDNTGSMSSSGKMTALKTAAKSLIDQLSTSAKTPGDVYISIIPFAVDVNIGTANKTATWLKWNGQSDTWDENNGNCSGYSGSSKPKTKSACLNKSGTWTVASHDTWNGCVADRDQNYDTLSTAPTTTTSATLFPADQATACPVQMMALSYDWTALKAKVDTMNPSGNTNQAIGMAWGWLSLLQQSPLNAPAEDPNFKYTKVVILLSDGDNTENRFSTNASAIDTRQKLLCDNAKAAGVQVYTIQVNTDGSANSSVMSYCASNSNNYFSTTSSSGIGTAFSSIGASLSKLRVAK